MVEKEKTIEKLRDFFVDPCDPESVEDLAQLGAEAIRTMAQIYTCGGDIEKMPLRFKAWLESDFGGLNSELAQVVGQLLAKEAKTRRFDHRFMGQIHPSGSKVGVLGHLVAAFMNTNTIVKEVSGSEHAMELEVTTWLAKMFGYDPEISSGNITTGGTTANIAALWVARQRKIKEWRQNHRASLRKPLIILSNDMIHYSVTKSADLLGVSLAKLPTKGLKTCVETLDQVLCEMSEEKRERIMAIVCAAGETETGLVDDLEGLADVAEKHNIFLHVDAAYGGPFILSRVGWRFKGIEKADSITVDPHKMLYVPYSAGAVLFKKRKDHALVQMSARYLQPKKNEGLLGNPEERNFGFAARVEGSMSSAGVISTWATWKLLGEDGLAVVLNHNLDMTNFAYQRVLSSGLLRPVHSPELNTFLVGLRPDLGIPASGYSELLSSVQRIVDEQWPSYISFNGEVDGGRGALRFIAVHPYTTECEVDELFSQLEYEITEKIDPRPILRKAA